MYLIMCINGLYLRADHNCPDWGAFKRWAYTWCDQPDVAYRFASLGKAMEWYMSTDRPKCHIVPA